VHQCAPLRLVDAEYPGGEQRREHGQQGHAQGQPGHDSGQGAAGLAGRVGLRPQQVQRNADAERARHAEQQPADLAPLRSRAVPVAHRQQDHAGHGPERIRVVYRRGQPAQRGQGSHRRAEADQRGQVLAGRPAGEREIGAAEGAEHRHGRGHCRGRPDDEPVRAAHRAARGEEPEQADNGHGNGGAAPLAHQRGQHGPRRGEPPVLLGRRDEHVAERHLGAERGAETDQPPDDPVLRAAQESDGPDDAERHGPVQQPASFAAVSGGHRDAQGSGERAVAKHRDRGDCSPHGIHCESAGRETPCGQPQRRPEVDRRQRRNTPGEPRRARRPILRQSGRDRAVTVGPGASRPARRDPAADVEHRR
jgi:hypothetical protein